MSDRKILVAAALVFAAGLALAFLAPGATAQVSQHDFVGAEGCRGCHPAEYETWAKGPHARAYARLSPEDRKDRRCLECHTLVPDDVDLSLQGVQCESCHGAGRFYAKAWVMRDAELRAALNFLEVDRTTCARCHTDKTPSIRGFDYELKAERIRHWKGE